MSDLGDFIDLDETPSSRGQPHVAVQSSNDFSEADIDFGDGGEQEYPYGFQYKHLSKKQYENLSPEEKKKLQNYVPLTGVAKGVASGATFGGSQYIPGMKIEPHETGAGVGEVIGMAAPLHFGFKALNLGTNLIPSAYKWTQHALRTAGAGGLFGSYEATREVVSGEEISPENIALATAVGAAGDVVIRSLMRVPDGYRWLKSLTNNQQESIARGMIPNNLDPTSYKLYQDEIAPRLMKLAESEYQAAEQQAIQQTENEFKSTIQKNDFEYKQKLANTKAQHEQQLYKNAETEAEAKAEYDRLTQEHHQKQQEAKMEYEQKLSDIQKQNQQAKAQFEEQQEDYDQMVRREQVVQNAIRNVDENTPIDMMQTPPIVNDVENQIGSIISPEQNPNTTVGGTRNIQAVRAQAAQEYSTVNELYTLSEGMNELIHDVQPSLAQFCQNGIRELDAIPHLSGPSQRLRNAFQNMLDRLVVLDEAGNITGYREVSNRVLQEQAKELRRSVDFDFAQGNPSAIYQPFIGELEQSAIQTAQGAGNEAAAQSGIEARHANRQWQELYNNPKIKSYRDLSNYEPSRTYESSLNIDDYQLVDAVLSRSNAGQQLSNMTKRDLVQKTLSKFAKNPNKISPSELNQALNELSPVLTPEETAAIRQTLASSRNVPEIVGKAPTPPKMKEMPKPPTEKAPPTPPKAKPIEKVQIPTKPSVAKPEVKPTPEMKVAAQRMKITPEEAQQMVNSRSGMKDLRKRLSGSENDKELAEKAIKYKVRSIMQEGEIVKNPSGNDLAKVLNKENNFDLIAEAIGEEEAQGLLDIALEAQEKRLTIELVQKIVKNTAKKAALVKTLGILGIL